MIPLSITLLGAPRTKKNSQRIMMSATGRRFVKPSQAYEEYERDCLWQITGGMKKRIADPVNLRCVYFMPTHRRVDLVNLLEATLDILVRADVIEDDNCEIAASYDGSRVDFDKNNPRVEILITPKREGDHSAEQE